MKVQLCFTVPKETEKVDVIISKMNELKTVLDNDYGDGYTVHSCHLPRAIVEAKNFDTRICLAFETIFGDKYVNEVKATDFDGAMLNMNAYRVKTSKKVDKLIILESEKVSNVALELRYFTDNRVMVI